MTEWFQGMAGGGPGWFGMDTRVWLALIRVVLVVVVTLVMLILAIWWERRLLAFFQDRLGPNRTGTVTIREDFPIKWLRRRKIYTFGLVQPLMDGLKLFVKEDITPTLVDRTIYFVGPALAIFPSFALTALVPWGPSWAGPGGQSLYGYLTPVANVNIGVLILLALSSIGVYGIVLAGYSSNNKYSLMGGLRSCAQMISYELSMGVALAAVVMAAGTLNLPELVRTQEGALWGLSPIFQNWFILTPFGLIAAVVYLVSMVAETNRVPFDLPEGENELIGGYHTEFSSMKFATFYMGEYASMFVYGGIFATVFLGGYNLLPVNWVELAQVAPAGAGLFRFLANANYWLAPIGFLLKAAAVVSFYIWLRATFPRLRYDQLMKLGWKGLLPIGVANLVLVGVWVVAGSISERAGYGTMGGWLAVVVALLVMAVIYFNILAGSKKAGTGFGKREIKMVDPKVTG